MRIHFSDIVIFHTSPLQNNGIVFAMFYEAFCHLNSPRYCITKVCFTKIISTLRQLYQDNGDFFNKDVFIFSSAPMESFMSLC